MDQKKETVTIIGVGRLGTALAHVLYRNQYPLVALIDQKLSRVQKLAPKLKTSISSNSIFDIPDTQIIFIVVPDDAIASVVAELTILLEQHPVPQFIFHTSGAVTSDVLQPLKDYGVACASFHPIQTFSGEKDDWKKFANIYFGLEGDLTALQKAAQIISDLKAHRLIIPKEFKPLYHLACTIASNYFIAILVPVVNILKRLNFSEPETLKIIYPLISTTLDHLRKRGLSGALTGPLVRGDVGTITKHIEILGTMSANYQLLYQQLGKMLLDLIYDNELNQQKYQQLMKLLNEQRATT